MATRSIFQGRDSNLRYQLLNDGVAQDLTNLSKIEQVFSTTIKLTGTVGTTEPLDFSTRKNELILNLANQSLTNGSYPSVKVIIYDSENNNGLIWGTISLVIKINPYA